MFNMIKFEIHKLFRSKSFYICSGLMLGLILLIAFFESKFLSSRFFSGILFSEMAVENSNIIFILPIFISMFVCYDSASGTLKNIYAKGYSRSIVYFAKCIVSIITSLAIICTCILLSLLLGELLFKKESVVGTVDIYILVSEILFIFFYCIIYFAVSIVIGKKGIAIAINIVGPVILSGILEIIDVIADLEIELSSYLLNNLYSDIFDGYLYGLESSSLVLEADIISKFQKFILFGVIYIIVAFGVSFLINRRKEV